MLVCSHQNGATDERATGFLLRIHDCVQLMPYHSGLGPLACAGWSSFRGWSPPVDQFRAQISNETTLSIAPTAKR